MYSIHANKNTYLGLFFLSIYLLSITPAAAIGEASTSLYVYVPPGGESPDKTSTYITVTATLDDTLVDIIDLDRTLGDPTNTSSDDAPFPVINDTDFDLSEYQVYLDRGQSRVIKVSYNGGLPDSDGAYFHVLATKPVTVYTGMGEGRVQADFVPSNNGTMIGNGFFIYLPDCWDAGSSGRHFYDLVVFPFEDNTNVSIYNISTVQTLVEESNPLHRNATTSINFSSAILIANDTLYPITPNNSLNHKPILYLQALNGSGIERGYTYFVSADKNVSVASVGILNDNGKEERARDGAYQVPGISENPYRFGTGLAHTFYFQLNGQIENGNEENEIYLINQNTINTSIVTIEEFDHNNWTWKKIPGEDNDITNRNGMFNVSSSSITGVLGNVVDRYDFQGLMRVTSNDSSGNPMDISVFSGIWLETAGGSTADIATFISGDTGYGGSKETIFYVPPPGKQPFFNNRLLTHVYIYVHNNHTNITIQSWNLTGSKWKDVYHGNYINVSKNQIIDYRINSNQWDNGMDKNWSTGWDFHRLRVLTSERTTVQINNWNDNWATYVPGGTPPDFSSKISIQSRYLTVNSIPVPRVRYSFDITNGAIGNIGSNLFDLSVTNSIPDGIDQREFFWSVKSNMDGFEYNSSYLHDRSEETISNGTKYIWKNSTYGINATIFAYNDGSGTVFIFNKSIIQKNENLNFNINTPLNSTYYNGNPIQSGVMVINVRVQAENPFLGKVTAYAKLPGTIILRYISPGTIRLY